MAVIVPFITKRGAQVPQALTEERLRNIAGLVFALRVALKDAYADLECGMPYLGTTLRLQRNLDLPPFVIDESENILRNANSLN